MMIHRRVSGSIALAVLLACTAIPASADRGDDDGRANPRQDKPGHDKDHRDDMRRDNNHYKPPGYVLDNRYRHDHYYPPRGYVAPALPPGHRVIPYRGQNYYFHGGVWYRPSGSRYIVVLPPVGMYVPFLPPFYTNIWIGGLPYYYAGGVYYTWRPEQRGYVVAEAPPASEVSELPETPDQLFVYPTRGQSEEQQATDRYQCHRWASDQTGFDPTQPLGNLSESQHASKRSDYQRAMKACLEARGYSVQ